MNSREFAHEVTYRLQQHGHTALWAGGCVRDDLFGRVPKDYDVATSALPDEVRHLFGHHRTLPIGASFGVITVLGPKTADAIEVATFRRDGGYSDGRRPDSVEFTNAREDAIRRDFTINGMFFDPVEKKVIDYVGGREDLASGIVRAIGDPHQRFKEDKLRMLRAVRFATTFGFEIEAATKLAIIQHAPDISAVSVERIGVELRKILAHTNRAVGARLLRETKLLKYVVPDGDVLVRTESEWDELLATFGKLEEVDFVTAAALFLGPVLTAHGANPVYRAWRLTNEERSSLDWIMKYKPFLARGPEWKWSELQPVLVAHDARRALEILKAEAAGSGQTEAIDYCFERLSWPAEQLDPAPLIGGGDLIGSGLKPGVLFSRILTAVRAGQLDGELTTKVEAMELASAMAAEWSGNANEGQGE